MATKIGVRELVEFTMRSGNLRANSTSNNTAQMGSKIHRQLQKSQAGASFEKEVYLEIPLTINHTEYLINGRADGIVTKDDGYLIEEIKTSDLEFEDIEENTLSLYWGQAQIYAYIFMKDHDLKTIDLQLIYYQTSTKDVTKVDRSYSFKEAKDYFDHVTNIFSEWVEFREDIETKRNASIATLNFPFDHYRKNQHELAAAVYKTIVAQTRLFVEAPTGTGKTISTLFPAIKAIGQKNVNRLFYLTAKQSTRRVAEDTMTLLADSGLHLKSITITAKEQIIFPEEIDLPPNKNPYMIGYYDRLKPAMKAILSDHDQITREIVESYAREYTLDPFEFSLDVSLFCDLIICDYNYLFDPLVFLQRFFTNADDQFFLIDEAHNLVSRSRSMYTKEISDAPIKDLLAQAKDDQTQPTENLKKALRKYRRAFKPLKDLLEEQPDRELVNNAPSDTFNQKTADFMEAAQNWLDQLDEDDYASPFRKALLDYYFTCSAYLKISDYYDDAFRTRLFYDQADHFVIQQLCLDPSTFLNQSLNFGIGAVFFSATLSPLEYYQRLFGCEETGLRYQLPSPFDPSHQGIFVTNFIQTTYKKRPANESRIVESIHDMVSAKTGHYLVFLPSYAYLRQIVSAYEVAYPLENVVVQQTNMNATERDEFLTNFTNEDGKLLVGFAVLGGIFSEGIDLKGDQLSGVAIVSVGLPGLSTENNLLQAYFDENDEDGFQYAYQLPGMNHVLQAAGRLIRSEGDVGTILLIDQRFSSARYRNLFPLHWQHAQVVYTPDKLNEQLTQFWQRQGVDHENSSHT